MSIMTKEGFVALRVVYGVALLGVAVAAAMVAGSYYYWQLEKKNDQTSTRQQSEARTRLANAKQQRSDVREAAQTFQALNMRGIFLPETRLELIELLAALKKQYRLSSLEYEVGPQRPLVLANGANYAGIRVLSSRLKVKAAGENDADLVAFFEVFPTLQRGIFPMDRCVLKREAKAEAATATATAATVSTATSNTPALTAECGVEWVTMKDVPQTPPAPSAPARRQ